MQISVIICTHNPRPDYLRRVLDALQAQTLPKEEWELLLIDNASDEPLDKKWDLSWHLHGRHIRESELGLTPARFRGIKESLGDSLVFVDDDNVLAADYLSVARDLMLSRPWIGALGGGFIGEFESEPEHMDQAVLDNLALFEVKHEAWGCLPGTKALVFAPCGAGMVIRRAVCAFYAKNAATDSLRRGLGRKGASLASAEDSDMALSACALGFAVGRFPQLQLTHLIPARRLKKDYLLRLSEEMTFSHTLLAFVWDGVVPSMTEDRPSRSERLFRSYRAMRSFLKGGALSFEVERGNARARGFEKAAKLIQSQQKGIS
ncbi:MAG TPA: glycosyltransferase [Candidatus Methylacidiphilales bacterium]